MGGQRQSPQGRGAERGADRRAARPQASAEGRLIAGTRAPAVAAIFHIFDHLLRDVAAVDAVDDMQCSVDAGGQPARGNEFPVVDVASVPDQFYLRELLLEGVEEIVVRRRGQTVEQPGLGQKEGAGAVGLRGDPPSSSFMFPPVDYGAWMRSARPGGKLIGVKWRSVGRSDDRPAKQRERFG